LEFGETEAHPDIVGKTVIFDQNVPPVVLYIGCIVSLPHAKTVNPSPDHAILVQLWLPDP
jgi:hypothetical protein